MPGNITSLREAVAANPEASSVARKILDYVVQRIEDDPQGAETLAAELKANASVIAEAATPTPLASSKAPQSQQVQAKPHPQEPYVPKKQEHTKPEKPSRFTRKR